MNWGGPVYGRYSIQCKCFIFLLFAYMRQCTMRQCTVCSFFTASWFSCAVKLYIRGIFSLCVYVQILTLTFMHLADTFIQSDLQLHSGYTFSLVHVFPGNRTHNLLRSWRNALPLSHTVFHTGTLCGSVYTNMCLLKYVLLYADSWI